MADTVFITSDVTDGNTINADLSAGVTITTSVNESTSSSANVTTGGIGPAGVAGTDGTDGADGVAATVTVGTTSTLSPGASATVTNSGSSSAATFNFGIPAGVKGDTGPSGGLSRTISAISSPTNAGSTGNTDYVYLVSGTTTLTLPTAVSNTNRYSVTNVGTSTVTVATTSAQTINGSLTATLPIPNMSLDFISNGSNWAVE